MNLCSRPFGLLLVLTSACFGVQPKTPEPANHWIQKDFLITFWCPPPATDQALGAVADEHFNLTWVPEEGLDVAARHHLRAMLTSDLLRPEILDDPAKAGQLEALIRRVKSHPALEAYFITDEPGADAFPALGKLVNFLRQRDPAHLAYINLFPTYANEKQLQVSVSTADRARADFPTDLHGVETNNPVVLRYREHLKRFVEIVKPDLISYDHYHFFKTSDGKEYFLNLALIRSAAMEANRPFLNIIQADTIEKPWRLPNASEMRWLVYTTLAYGGRGISYFTYWGPKSYNGLYQDGVPSPLLKDVATLNREIAKLGPMLMQMESTDVYHSEPLPLGTKEVRWDSPVKVENEGKFVLGLFRNARSTAFMIVNRNYKDPTQAILKIKARKVQEFDRQTGRWAKADRVPKNGALTISLEPGDGRFFRMAR